MYIRLVAIENYKSFLEQQTIRFEPGFNLLVGTNNAGKTSVLDVMDMEIGLNEPHRSERTIPQFGGLPNPRSVFEVSLATSFGELWRLVGASQMYLPIQRGNLSDVDVASAMQLVARDDQALILTSRFGQGAEALAFTGNELISGVASRQDGNVISSVLIQANPNGQELQIQPMNTQLHSTSATYGQSFRQRIYRFSAQRRPGFQCGAQGTVVLDREAVTLPYCINHLQTNDAHGHRILCAWVNRVFPSVKWIQATPNGGNFELRCLPQAPEARRDDLAIPISRMGAGIGNVIAMFYVVLTARDPQVIAIDEPNAFLHPRALRELLSILEAEGKQHQFILTAHSADVLTAVNTRSISLLEFDGVATQVQQVGPKDLHLLRSGLADLGIRMTDLHAKDQVFWVEGQTEELVMPALLRWACPEVAAGTAVLRVERTGTFSKKKGIEPAEVAQIYERLSKSSALVPPMVCILLDGESLTEAKRKDIETASFGRLRFLDRRMLENYLLHPLAIQTALSELGLEVEIAEIEGSLERALGTNDLVSVDAASALHSSFTELSESKLEFRKTRDVPVMIEWILANSPAHLAPLRECLRKSFELKG
ncbi:ATP-dependent nuclease [Rhodoferax mekongensis]|uniref:ATP-dependent nuclease n=1 Tax=Rhodoferax mekongensis TaxID=3068341 RepID=UPI0028BD5D1E|nr:AAA family ATPase [Rhodoferax sp. TBRC 17199]MDT7514874.1 AAA family ATPase [Rhodoferax sp. TBRC 17199]